MLDFCCVFQDIFEVFRIIFCCGSTRSPASSPLAATCGMRCADRRPLAKLDECCICLQGFLASRKIWVLFFCGRPFYPISFDIYSDVNPSGWSWRCQPSAQRSRGADSSWFACVALCGPTRGSCNLSCWLCPSQWWRWTSGGPGSCPPCGPAFVRATCDPAEKSDTMCGMCRWHLQARQWLAEPRALLTTPWSCCCSEPWRLSLRQPCCKSCDVRHRDDDDGGGDVQKLLSNYCFSSLR